MATPTTPEPPPLGLSRTAGHVYSFNTGSEVFSPLPSVTTVIGVLDKSGPLVGWAKRETAACAVRNLEMLIQMRETGGDAAATDWLKKIPDYRRDSAADVGSRIHALAEQINRGLQPAVTPDEAPFIDAYRAFLASFRPRFIAAEEMVVSLRHRYAGTLDAIAVIDRETWLLDIKTGTGLYAETGLQLAGYASADFIGRPGTPRRFRLPRASRFGVVHVRPERAHLVEYRVDRGTFAAFLEARRLYEWLQGPAKTAVGAVVTATGRSAAA
ncbi:MAG: hypothetical protein P4L84_06280 [Isosphaeraceae bacterium]|nr:hypothetical protein [Isosphaeraceae bacterium]